ncbi:glycosyltransferase family 8 protein [Coraliomargarita parva]|uniref:glycosyltransferase family 8 protein n=1 Tax=Coraliomargarita parva TaxID=3014050 RepID=UPI0022B5448F|nr:glycosyltransferase family 8 protein [Coraliomargarita parva]
MPANTALVFSFNKDFGPALMNSLGSVFLTSALDTFNIHIFYDIRDEPEVWFDRILCLCDRFTFPRDRIRFHPVELGYFENRLPQLSISSLSYARFYIPELLSEDTVIYLDADTLVLKDLCELARLCPNDAPLAAVLDSFNPTHEYDGYTYKGQPASTTENYFNSGVMVINRKRCAEINLFKAFERVLPDLVLGSFNDQTYLNVIFKGNWMRLPDEWNVQSPPRHPAARRCDFSKMALLHYVTKEKPWKCAHYDVPNLLWHTLALQLNVAEDIPGIKAVHGKLTTCRRHFRFMERIGLLRAFPRFARSLLKAKPNKKVYRRYMEDVRKNLPWMDQWLANCRLKPVREAWRLDR